MKNILKVDSKNKRLVMDRTFAKNAEIVGSKEYIILQDARRDYPSYNVDRRQIKRNPNKECYHGLTYSYMRKYIASHEKDPEPVLAELEEMIGISKCHSLCKRYPTIKKWFLDRYPAVAEFGMEHDEVPPVSFDEAA